MDGMSSPTENGRFRFMEWLRGGFSRGRSGNTTQPTRPADRSDEEKEESDDETAPYLSYDPRKMNGRSQRTEKDPRKDDSRGGTKVCAGCKCNIGREAYLGIMETLFHPQCIWCRACGHPITELEFSLSGSSETYHKSCFKELTHPKCYVCHQFIPSNKDGTIEYGSHPFWLQKYCPWHDHDNTSRCYSCERLEKPGFLMPEDQINLCSECTQSSIIETGKSLLLYHAVRNFYEGLNMKLDHQIPLHLVDRRALIIAVVGEGRHFAPGTRSTTLCEEQNVSSQIKGLSHGPRTLIRKCKVTAILVLNGLPRLAIGAELAYQLMYSWLCLEGYRNLTPEVEVGICRYLSHVWLESEVTSTSSSSSTKSHNLVVEKKLGQYFIYKLTTEPAHGEGYRAANAAVNKYGLRATLEHVRRTGTFPQ